MPPGLPDRQGPAPDPADGVGELVKRRLWVITCCLALTLLAFADRPGKIIADTSLNLAINPLSFLVRAAHLWDPAQFGQVQNQAPGYFFPMGAFFVAGKFLALQPWVVQRLWMTAIGIAAFLGVARLTARLGVGTSATQLVAGLAYALAPAELSQLGVNSIGLLPAAMAPWILLPLVRAVHDAQDGRPGGRARAAAQSAVAVALCGGTGAIPVLAALLPALIYLLSIPRSAGGSGPSRARGWPPGSRVSPRVSTARWRILAWWLPLVAAVTGYWAYSLLVLGRYAAPQAPYTAGAAVTTSVMSLSNTLHGTENVAAYLVADGHAWWPAGGSIAATISTGLLAGLGLTGLLVARLPLRRTWLCTLVIGLLIVGTGYLGALGNPLALTLQHLMNGPLALLRNPRAFDPLIRLPLAIGLAHLLATVQLPAGRKVVASVAVAGIGVLALPAFTSGLSAPGDFQAIPGYWQDAASWLSRHAGNQAVLEVPGARFGAYLWGRPADDVLQPLFSGDWASRRVGSLGSPGLARVLDAVDQRLAAGEGSAGLSALLARMGVKYVLVRNDLARADLYGAWPARIHQALSESPGIVKVARFGALPVGRLYPDDAVKNLDTLYWPVEIYQVTGVQPEAELLPAAAAVRVYGGPEALLTLADEHALAGRPVLLNSDDAGARASQTVVTDSLRRRTRNFGEIRVGYSATLTGTDPASTFEAAADYLEPGWSRYASTARYFGIAQVTASSSDAGIGAVPGQSATGRLPFSAVDGDLRTMWESGSLAGPVGQWIKIGFIRPVDPRAINVAFADNAAIGPAVTAVTIATAAGQRSDRVLPGSGFQRLAGPAGPSSWLRLTITGTQGRASQAIGKQAGIFEIEVPGVSASRAIVAPAVSLPGQVNPNAFVLAKAQPRPSDCMLTSARWVCVPALMRPAEEQYGFDHVFTAARAQAFSLSGSAVLTNVNLIERYAWLGASEPRVTGSSSYTQDPQTQPQSAFDDDLRTAWVAGGGDRQPRLTIRWAHATTVSAVTIVRPGASGPAQVTILGAHGQARADLVQPVATIKFAAMRTASLTFAFTPSTLPLQVTEIAIPGVTPLSTLGSAPFQLPCGSGPAIELNGRYVPTRTTGTLADLHDGAPMAFAACAPVPVAAGTNRVVEPSLDNFDVQAVVLDQAGRAAIGPGRAVGREPVQVLTWGPARRVLRVRATAQSYLIVNQNFNAGWVARIGSQVLRPVRLDGWKQGWLLPAVGAAQVTLTYAPDVGFRLSLLVGLAALGAVLLMAIWPRRRQAEAADRPVAPDQGSSRSSSRVQLPRGQAIVRVLAGAAAGGCAGLWLGGYLGAIVVLVTCALFAAVLTLSDRYRLARYGSSPWLVMLFLIAASVSEVVGGYLRGEGLGGATVTSLRAAGPQVLCLLIVGRLVAALVFARDR